MVLLVSVNVQGACHMTERVIPFLREIRPDVVCLQEFLLRDLPEISRECGPHSSFAPMAHDMRYQITNDPRPTIGVAICSRFPFRAICRYYRGSPKTLRDMVPSDADTVARALLMAGFVLNGTKYCIGTTHFTWSPNGKPNTEQCRDLPKLLGELRFQKQVLLCGDLNLPRGGELFAKIAAQYSDLIPRGYASSLDPVLHRAKGLELMVDGLFVTPGAYRASDVRLVPGVSDHRAIVAEIVRDIRH